MTKNNITKPNPALKSLELLVGHWEMEITNAAYLPDPSTKASGQVTFKWIEDGAYLLMRQGGKKSGSSFALWTIQRDESAKENEYVVFYYDDRRVSRIYQMSFGQNEWKIWREAAGFYQRFKGLISQDGETIRATWENSPDGKNWKHDFDITYTRR